MMNGPKITVITVCFNAENTIEQTIQSVIKQSYKNLEYIIIDGLSTDSTLEIVNKYKDHISTIVSEPDKGIYDAFNKGVSLANGDYINFMNADDFFSTDDIVEKVANYLQENNEVRLLYGNVKAINEVTGSWYIDGQIMTTEKLKYGKMCPHQSVFTHKQLFQEIGAFDLRYKILADVDFTIKCFKKYELCTAYLPLEIACFRLGGISSNIQNEKKMYTENAIIHLDHFQYIPTFITDYLESYEAIQKNKYYQLWLENLLLGKAGVAEQLKADDKVVIFGTKANATNLYLNLIKDGIKVQYFLDNNPIMQGRLLHDVPVISPMELDASSEYTIVVSIERQTVANEIKDELVGRMSNSKVLVWYELLT